MRNQHVKPSAHRQSILGERAAEMRASLTPSEQVLWRAIRGRRLGVQFRRQVPLEGRYIADFYAAELRLVVEVEGGYHARLRARSDERRTRFLNARGYAVVRLPDELVLRQLNAAIALVSTAIAARRA